MSLANIFYFMIYKHDKVIKIPFSCQAARDTKIRVEWCYTQRINIMLKDLGLKFDTQYSNTRVMHSANFNTIVPTFFSEEYLLLSFLSNNKTWNIYGKYKKNEPQSTNALAPRQRNKWERQSAKCMLFFSFRFEMSGK